MVNLTPFQNINHYRELSFFQACRLSSLTKRVVALDHNINVNHQALLQWEVIARRIHTNIHTPRSWSQAIIDTLTLQFVKKWIVQITLPSALKRIDRAIIVATNTRQPGYIPSTNPTAPNTRIRTTSPLDVIMKANERFQTLKDERDFKAKHTAAVIAEVEEYFKDKITLLLENPNAPLPFWYHATRPNNFMKIINDNKLKISPFGAYGAGVYFSLEDEFSQHGPYTFAIDHSFFNNSPNINCVNVNSYYQQKSTIWASVNKEVPVKWESVAHIVVATQQDKESLIAKYQSARAGEDDLDENSLSIATCPIITRNASHLIREMIQDTYMYVIPSTWNWHPNYYGLNLPPHVRKETPED